MRQGTFPVKAQGHFLVCGKVSQELMVGHKKLRGRLASEAPACAGSWAPLGSLWSVPGTRALGP